MLKLPFLAITFLTMIRGGTRAQYDPSNYTGWERYIRHNRPIVQCPNYYCEYFELKQSEIDGLVEIVNTFRSWVAVAFNLSNLYSVRWNKNLAVYAQLKALECPAPTRNSRLFDSPGYAAVEGYVYQGESYDYIFNMGYVKIDTRSVAGFLTNRHAMRNSAAGYYKYLLNYLPDIPFVGGTIHLGCGYLLRRNETHFIDFFVCIFAPILTTKILIHYKHTYGQPCTACDAVYGVVTTNKRFKYLPILPQGKEDKCDRNYRDLCAVSKRFNDFVCELLAPNNINLFCIKGLNYLPFKKPRLIYPPVTTLPVQQYRDSCPLLLIYTSIIANFILILMTIVSIYVYYYLELYVL